MKFGIPLARVHPGLWPDLTKHAGKPLIVSPRQRTREALDEIARFADEYFDKAAAIGGVGP